MTVVPFVDNRLEISKFWKTPDLEENELVYIINLGPSYGDKKFKAIVKGYYACDVDGHPDSYIVEMIDPLPTGPNPKPGELMKCHVFIRSCVISVNSYDAEEIGQQNFKPLLSR